VPRGSGDGVIQLVGKEFGVRGHGELVVMRE
jgi:hypothetical protein